MVYIWFVYVEKSFSRLSFVEDRITADKGCLNQLLFHTGYTMDTKQASVFDKF